MVRSHLPLCPPPVAKEQPGELPDEELQRERVGSWGQELEGWEAWLAEQEEEPGGKVSRLGGEQGARVHGRPYSWLVRRGTQQRGGELVRCEGQRRLDLHPEGGRAYRVGGFKF